MANGGKPGATGASREDVAQPVDLDAAARRARPFDEQVAHQFVTGPLRWA
jgi:hypothetical protein